MILFLKMIFKFFFPTKLEIMPKYSKKNKKSKNFTESKRELTKKEEGQSYAKILKLLGNSRARCYCYDGVERLGVIRKRMKRRRQYVNEGDFVLVGLRSFQDSVCDIMLKYKDPEVRRLIKLGEIIEKDDKTSTGGIVFKEESDDDIDFKDI